MIRIAAILIVAVAAVGVVAAGCNTEVETTKTSDCAGCTAMKDEGSGWCASCSKGMVDGEAVKCEGCYKAKTGGPDCPTCKK